MYHAFRFNYYFTFSFRSIDQVFFFISYLFKKIYRPIKLIWKINKYNLVYKVDSNTKNENNNL